MPVAKRSANWGVAARGEPRWPASLAVIAAVILYVTLPSRLVAGPVWLLPLAELALLVPLTVLVPHRHSNESRLERLAALGLIALINLANLASLVALIHLLLLGTKTPGTNLFFAALEIWLTNVIVFSLWYWELDRGGPDERATEHHRHPDFLFPQMATPGCTEAGWSPRFLDYIYVSFTNASAFSPTDTMPLTRTAKMLMLLQALASILTVTLVAARAVNVLQ